MDGHVEHMEVMQMAYHSTEYAVQQGATTIYSFLKEEKNPRRQHQWSPRKTSGDTHKDNALEPRLEPCHRVFLNHSMLRADSRLLNLPLRNAVPRAAHNDVKVHAEDTNRGIVSRTEVNMLLNSKSKVARLGKVASTELVLLHFKTALKNLFSFGPTNRDVDGNLFVAPDTELADGVAGLGGHWRLARELFEDFGRSRQTVTRLPNGYILERAGKKTNLCQDAMKGNVGRTY